MNPIPDSNAASMNPDETPEASYRLLRAFESQSLAPGEFRHREHVEIAWIYLQRFPVLVALQKVVQGIQNLADALGAEGLYHETITWAYVLLVHERIQDAPQANWTQFAAANADLLTWKPSILEKYYREETLWSDRARRGFLMPDRIVSQDASSGCREVG